MNLFIYGQNFVLQKKNIKEVFLMMIHNLFQRKLNLIFNLFFASLFNKF